MVCHSEALRVAWEYPPGSAPGAASGQGSDGHLVALGPPRRAAPGTGRLAWDQYLYHLVRPARYRVHLELESELVRDRDSHPQAQEQDGDGRRDHRLAGTGSQELFQLGEALFPQHVSPLSDPGDIACFKHSINGDDQTKCPLAQGSKGLTRSGPTACWDHGACIVPPYTTGSFLPRGAVAYSEEPGYGPQVSSSRLCSWELWPRVRRQVTGEGNEDEGDD